MPIGCNLNFDLFTLWSRGRAIGVDISLETLLYDHPYVNIQPILVMINEGAFKGAGLAQFTGKEHSGLNMASWYASKDYAAIEAHIRDEADPFSYLYKSVKRRFPEIREWWFNQMLPKYKVRD